MSDPRVAVVVPCFNHGEYLPEALASVEAQTCRAFEVVVVDDGSFDPATLACLDRLEREGLRVIRTENRGLPSARNTGIRHTTAPYVCALDADDRLAPEWFARAVSVLDASPDVAFVSHWLKAFGAEEWEWRPESCDLPALLACNTVNGAALVRRAALEAIGGYDEAFTRGCEDWDLWLTLVEKGFRGVIVPEVLFYYRRRADSMSRVMFGSGVHVDVLSDLVRKHGATYRAHIVDALVGHDQVHGTQRLRREIADLEREYAEGLGPLESAETEQVRRLEGKAARLRGDLSREQTIADLTARVDWLQGRVAELQRSWSWRLTAPLRGLMNLARGSGDR